MGVVTTLRIPLLQRLDTYIANPLDLQSICSDSIRISLEFTDP